MKYQGKTAILETLEEVDEVFWGPTNWDSRRGGSRCGYYAAYHCLNLPESQAENFDIQCATKDLDRYWRALYNVETGFASFDFSVGKEDTKYEKKVRESDDPYLLAAMHISKIGVDNFSVEISNGSDYRGVKFTNKVTNKSFTFKDTVDHDLTTDAINLYNALEANAEDDALVDELNEFTRTL